MAEGPDQVQFNKSRAKLRHQDLNFLGCILDGILTKCSELSIRKQTRELFESQMEVGACA